MKVGGWILIVLGALNVVLRLGAMSECPPEYRGDQVGLIFFGIIMLVGGVILLNKAEKKKQESKKRDEWLNGK